jgi:hypothetical protein
MAFSEDIITTIGADTRPFAKGLRTMKAQVAIVSKEMNGQMQTSLKAWLGFLGPAGVIAGLKKVFDLAKGVNEEGKEFTKGGWVSAENASVLNETAKAFENIFKSAVSLGAYTLGYIGKAARYLGALSVTGDLAEADRIVNKMAQADSDAIATMSKKQLEEYVLKLKTAKLEKEKKITDQLEKQYRLLVAQDRALGTARGDRTKFTLEELATANVRQGTFMAHEKFKANAILALESTAEQYKSNPTFANLAIAERSLKRAEEMRATLRNVISSETKPYASLEGAANATADSMRELIAMANSQGIPVRPKNSK